MKKIVLSIAIVGLMASCGGTKEASSTSSNMGSMAAKKMLSTLTSKSSLEDISKLFNLLDVNADGVISQTEAIGDVLKNFGVLDTNGDDGIDVNELAGLLTML